MDNCLCIIMMRAICFVRRRRRFLSLSLLNENIRIATSACVSMNLRDTNEIVDGRGEQLVRR